ncbi:DNA glycosylase [Camillea tinctor]|nr:DNA glycosylase [Camillea tinctor]
MARNNNQEDSTEAATTEEVRLKEPSFEGRLKLNDFMFKAGSSANALQATASPAPPGIRRSARLLTASGPPCSTPSSSSTPLSTTRDNPPSKPKPSPKRKAPTTTTTTTAPYFPSSSPAKKPRRRQTYAPPSTYAHLPLLPDALGPELLILFVGLNPGLETARTGHAYAHPSNLFWKLLCSSGITDPPPCRPYRAADDRDLPRRHGCGLTNIVARPSRSGAELSRAEMDAGVAALEAKCRGARAECVCFVGKSIWESVVRVRRGGKGLGKGEFAYGWQDGEGRFGAGEGWEGSRIFVATSTSGLAASLRPEEKERIWKVLGDWCVRRRGEREREREAREKGKLEGGGDGEGRDKAECVSRDSQQGEGES